MPRFGFAIDNRACIGCHACTVACKSEHLVPLGVNRTWVKYIEKGEFPHTRRHFSVQRCNHCEDAPCVEICPVTSLFKRPDGIVDFDNSRCIGCKACMQACPYDALYLDPETNTAAKCNYCTHRVDNGYEPACVVVCPVEAIVSGDLDDPESRIAQLDRQQKVQYPKPEKATQPKLFYVGGETAALDPAAAPPELNYLWSGNDGRITPAALRRAEDESAGESATRARRVYDPRSKPAPWGWMVSAYITTKAIAAGLPMVAFILYCLNLTAAAAPSAPFAVSMAFLAATGALLVGDLKQPQRFLWVLLRPQWKSWLVRGAYLIGAFAFVQALTWLLGVAGVGRIAQMTTGWIGFALAGAAAGYTALLLAQARGRDYWQNPLLVASMIADALVAGTAAAILLGLMSWEAGAVLVYSSDGPLAIRFGERADPARVCLGVGVGLLTVLLLAEFLPRHATRNAELAARHITRGPLAGWFWGGVVAAGLAIPAALLFAGAPSWTAAVLMVVGIAAKNHVLVQAPQCVPLS
ncbi:MAG: polysulfide reductase NrfD [Phycisphaerae bacterium]|jgi:Fe-S-cluster-containing dehydrogenase component/formate-dependent nitrite reductase membrane component NrfD